VATQIKQQLMLEKHKCIQRIDQDSKRTHGWYVRVKFQGKMETKLFSDKKYGGRQSGLELAIAWRNSTEKKLGKIRTDKHFLTVINSKTGVIGVRQNKKCNRYEVSWVTPEGKQGKTSVSIGKHGKKEAFIKACSIRQEKERLRLEG
jgi:AP2 domain-containing protein